MNAVETLQNFLNGYVVSAGRIVCIVGAIEIAISLSSTSPDKKVRGLKLFGTGLTIITASDIINIIFK